MKKGIIFGWLKQYVAAISGASENCAVLDAELNDIQECDKPELNEKSLYTGLGGYVGDSELSDAVWADIERQKEEMRRGKMDA